MAPFPPTSPSAQECGALQSAFTGLGSTSAYVLGDGLNGLQWHVFVAGVEAAHATRDPPLYTLEVCMTGLDPGKATQFFRGTAYVSAQHTTRASGIQALVPGAGGRGGVRSSQGSWGRAGRRGVCGWPAPSSSGGRASLAAPGMPGAC